MLLVTHSTSITVESIKRSQLGRNFKNLTLWLLVYRGAQNLGRLMKVMMIGRGGPSNAVTLWNGALCNNNIIFENLSKKNLFSTFLALHKSVWNLVDWRVTYLTIYLTIPRLEIWMGIAPSAINILPYFHTLHYIQLTIYTLQHFIQRLYISAPIGILYTLILNSQC